MYKSIIAYQRQCFLDFSMETENHSLWCSSTLFDDVFVGFAADAGESMLCHTILFNNKFFLACLCDQIVI